MMSSSGAASAPKAPGSEASAKGRSDGTADPGRGFGLLWGAAVLVPALVLAAAAFWSWQSVSRDARARLNRTLDMLHEHALRSFEVQEALIEAGDRRIAGMSWEAVRAAPEIQDFLTGLAERSNPSGGMILVGPDDQVAAASFALPSEPVTVSDRDYVRAHRAGVQGTHVGEAIRARPTDIPVFTMSRRRSSPSGAYDGLVVTSMKTAYFEDFYRSIAESRTDRVVLVRRDGAVLARTPAGRDGAGAGAVRLENLSGSDRALRTVRSPEDGTERLFGARQVGAYPVHVAYGLNSSVIRRAWFRQMAAFGLVCGLAALALLSFTAYAQRSVRRERTALAAARGEAERRADAEARLRHTQRVEALGQIVGGVAHDFNNIVMAVMAGVRRVDRKAEDPAEIRRVVGLMDAAVERGARLAQRMLAFARPEATPTSAFDVREALDSVTGLLEHTLGTGYRVRLDCPERFVCRGDRAEFEAVIVNLVVNARDAMPDGGTVTVSAGPEVVDEDGADPSALPPGRYGRIAVTDTGIGMDAATLARAGEAFFTTKEPGKGTGLGIATARAFAEHAGGRLHIASEPGRGTTVTLWLGSGDAAPAARGQDKPT